MTTYLTLAVLIALAATLIADIILALRGPAAVRGGTAGTAPTARSLLSPVVRIGVAAGLVLVVVVRSIAIGFAAIFSQYDSLVVFAALILVVIGVEQLRGSRSRELHGGVVLGSTLVALVLVAIASSPLVSSNPGPVMPALRSIWLPLHIILAFLGEAFFTLAFVGSIVWLLQSRRRRARAGTETGAVMDDQLARLDRLVYRSIAVGYGLFTVGGLIFGAIWAQLAWGRYWGWDPKETWALVTWIVYSIYLHARLQRWGRGAVSHWISIAGYLAAMFTLFGVNLLYRSLHAY